MGRYKNRKGPKSLHTYSPYFHVTTYLPNYLQTLPNSPTYLPLIHSVTLPPAHPPFCPPAHTLPAPTHLPIYPPYLPGSMSICLSICLPGYPDRKRLKNTERHFSCPKSKQSHHIKYLSTQSFMPRQLACSLASLSYIFPPFR